VTVNWVWIDYWNYLTLLRLLITLHRSLSLTNDLSRVVWQRLPTVDVPLLPGLSLCRLMTIYYFQLVWAGQTSVSLYDRRLVGRSVFALSPIRGRRSHFCYCQLRFCRCRPDERTGLYFTVAAGPRQRSLSRVRFPRGSWRYFYCLRFETLLTWRTRFL
jgi:hypothetical protein